MIEIEPDAMAVSTRFQAEHTIVGNVEKICRELTSRVETLSIKVEKKRSIQQSMKLDEDKMIEKFGYMMHNNPEAVERVVTNKRQLSLKRIVSDGIASVVKDADSLWKAIHNGEWRKIQDYSNHVRVVQEDQDNVDGKSYCHPDVLLAALSRARRDESTDSVSRNAAIAVDVGDVTLVSTARMHQCLSRTVCIAQYLTLVRTFV